MMPLLSRVRVCLLLLFALAGGPSAFGQQSPPTTVSDYGVSSDKQIDWRDASVDAWLQRLDAIELMLQRSDLREEARRQALEDIEKIDKAAQARRQKEESILEPIERELASLGAPPAEGEPPEPSRISTLRSEIKARIADSEARLGEIQLVLARKDNLEVVLISRGEGTVIDRLWIRSPILWNAQTWTLAGDNWLSLIDAVLKAPAEWWRNKSKTTQPTKLILAILAGLVALFFGVPARRWLQRRVRRDEAKREPTYGRRIYTAVLTAVADTLLPSLALGTVALSTHVLAHHDTLLPELAIAVCKAGIVYFVLTGLARAVLAPQAPAWRVLPVTEEGAVILNRRIHVVAVYFAIAGGIFDIAEYLGLLESPEFSAVTTLFLDGALALLLLSLLPTHYWQSGGEEEPNLTASGVSITLGVLLSTIPVLDLIGFSDLASYLLVILIVTVAAAGFTLLLRSAVLEALAVALRPGSKLRLALYRWFRLGDEGARVLRIVGRLLIDIVLFLALAYGLLRFYGLPDVLLMHWVQTFAEGVPIGNVVLSPVDFAGAVLVFIAILMATGFLRRWLSEKLRSGTQLDLGVRNAITAGVGYGGVVLAIIVAIAVIGLDLSNLALVAGALSVGVGFGLRTVVENFVAGLLLLIERPIKEGDWIVTAGHHGTVKRISVRSTEIETFDRASVIVPNAELVAQPVENWTHKNRVARIIVPVGVAYGSDTEKVRDILLACAENNPQLLKYPAPQVLFQQFGESSLDFELRCFVKDTDYFIIAKSDLNFAIDKAFREAGIEIPFPQRDLHLREGLPLKLEPTSETASGETAPAPEPKTAEAGTEPQAAAESDKTGP